MTTKAPSLNDTEAADDNLGSEALYQAKEVDCSKTRCQEEEKQL